MRSTAPGALEKDRHHGYQSQGLRTAPAKSQKPAANRPVSFEQAALLCPTEGQAERVAEKFGLCVPEYQAIRELHARALHDMAGGLAGALNDKATQRRCHEN